MLTLLQIMRPKIAAESSLLQTRKVLYFKPALNQIKLKLILISISKEPRVLYRLFIKIYSIGFKTPGMPLRTIAHKRLLGINSTDGKTTI